MAHLGEGSLTQPLLPGAATAPAAFRYAWWEQRTRFLENQLTATFVMAIVAAAAGIGQQLLVNLTNEQTQYLYGVCGLILAPVLPTVIPTLDTIWGRILANHNPESSYYQQNDFTLAEVGHTYQLTLILAVGLMALNAIFWGLAKEVLTLPLLNLNLDAGSISTITNVLPWLAMVALLGAKQQIDLILFCQTQMYRRAELLNLIAQVAPLIFTYVLLNQGLNGLAIGNFLGLLVTVILAVAMQLSNMKQYELFNFNPRAWGKQLQKYYDFNAIPLLVAGALSNLASIYSNLQGTINFQVVLAILTGLAAALAQVVIQVKGPNIEQQTGLARRKAIQEVLAFSTVPGILIMATGLAFAEQLKDFGGSNTKALTTENVRVNTALGMGSQIADILASTLALIAIDKGNTSIPAAVISATSLIIILMCAFNPISLGDDYKNAQGNIANLMGYSFALLAFGAYAVYQNYQTPQPTAAATSAATTPPETVAPFLQEARAPSPDHTALTMTTEGQNHAR